MGDRVKATNAFIIPLGMDLDSLRQSLRAKPIDLKSLPQGLLRDWVTQEGRERVDVLPKGNPNHDKTIATFARAVLVAEPAATGPAIEILKWAEAMIKSLIQAAAIAFCAIARRRGCEAEEREIELRLWSARSAPCRATHPAILAVRR